MFSPSAFSCRILEAEINSVYRQVKLQKRPEEFKLVLQVIACGGYIIGSLSLHSLQVYSGIPVPLE
jgi:hypothetical protein